MVLQIGYAAAATFCFAVLFNIRGIKLVLAPLGGGLSWAVFMLISRSAGPPVLALFLASLSAALYAEIYSLIARQHSTGMIICAIIPLVPGSGMYQTMYQVVGKNIDAAVAAGLDTFLRAGSIAAGIALASTLRRFFPKRNAAS